jgi:hypothetical protein
LATVKNGPSGTAAADGLWLSGWLVSAADGRADKQQNTESNYTNKKKKKRRRRKKKV